MRKIILIALIALTFLNCGGGNSSSTDSDNHDQADSQNEIPDSANNDSAVITLGDLVEYTSSLDATPGDFGIEDIDSEDLLFLSIIENQPEPGLVFWDATDTYRYFVDDDNYDVPFWIDYENFEVDSGLSTRIRNVVSLHGENVLKRGSYHITFPMLYDIIGPVNVTGTSTPFKKHIIVHVRGIGFVTDQLFVPHFIGDTFSSTGLVAQIAGANTGWQLTESPPWLDLSLQGGNSLGSLEINITKNAIFAALDPGCHRSEIAIKNDLGDQDSIPVYAVVERGRFYPLHKMRILYSLSDSEQLRSYSYIHSELSGNYSWEGHSNQDWLVLDSTEGNTGEPIWFEVEPELLSNGEHVAELIFTDPSGRNEETSIIVYYYKDFSRQGFWTISGGHNGIDVAPTTIHRYRAENGGLWAYNYLTGETTILSEVENYMSGSAMFSPEGQRVYTYAYNNLSHNYAIWAYSWPELEPIAQSYGEGLYTNMKILQSFGQDYAVPDVSVPVWLVNIKDGRRGEILNNAVTPWYNRKRIRIYDDGQDIVAYTEILEHPRGYGSYLHYARGPLASCRINWDDAAMLTCEDDGLRYIETSLTEIFGKRPSGLSLFFTHDGKILLHTWSDGLRLLDATGKKIEVSPDRQIYLTELKQVGDSLFIGYKDAITIESLMQ